MAAQPPAPTSPPPSGNRDDLILDWVSSIHTPRWVSNDIRSCQHCGDKLATGKRHNCRLCGRLFCGMCSKKYNVPERFRLKGKQNPVRVCFGCCDKALDRRSEAKNDRIPTRPRQLLKRTPEGLEILYPPAWTPPDQAIECFECERGFSSSSAYHHCRLCGHCFCGDCSTKVADKIPPGFRRKGKRGKTRVCFECRYRLHSGCILRNERPADAPTINLVVTEVAEASPPEPPTSPRSQEQTTVPPPPPPDNYAPPPPLVSHHHSPPPPSPLQSSPPPGLPAGYGASPHATSSPPPFYANEVPPVRYGAGPPAPPDGSSPPPPPPAPPVDTGPAPPPLPPRPTGAQFRGRGSVIDLDM